MKYCPNIRWLDKDNLFTTFRFSIFSSFSLNNNIILCRFQLRKDTFYSNYIQLDLNAWQRITNTEKDHVVEYLAKTRKSFCTDWSKFKTRKRRANILVFIFMDRPTCSIPIKYVNSFWLFQTKKGIGYFCFLLKLIVIWLFFPLDLGVDIDTVKLNTTKPRINSNKKVHVSFWENKWYNRIKMNTVRN